MSFLLLLSMLSPSLSADTPILYVRIDPQFEWIRKLEIEWGKKDDLLQPEKMWEQLIRHDKDIIAQFEVSLVDIPLARLSLKPLAVLIL